MNVAEVLRTAASLIETNGWWNGGYSGGSRGKVLPDGRTTAGIVADGGRCECVVTAIIRAVKPTGVVTSADNALINVATVALAHHLGVATGDDRDQWTRAIAEMNDAHPLTIESLHWAVNALRGAADTWEAMNMVTAP